jgi:hypothetical protein
MGSIKRSLVEMSDEREEDSGKAVIENAKTIIKLRSSYKL